MDGFPDISLTENARFKMYLKSVFIYRKFSCIDRSARNQSGVVKDIKVLKFRKDIVKRA